MSPLPPSVEVLELRLRLTIERVLRWLPHLNPVGRGLSFIILDDPTSPNPFGDLQVISERGQLLIPRSRVAQMSEQELTFLIAHGMIHVYFRHAERGQGKEPTLWQRACDYEANSALKVAGVALSQGALYDEALADRSAEALYELFKAQGPQTDSTSDDSGAACGGAGAPKHEWEHTAATWGAEPEQILVKVTVNEVAQSGASSSLKMEGSALESQGVYPCHNTTRGFGAQQLEESLAYQAKTLPRNTNPWATLLRDFMRHRAQRRSASRYRRRDIGQDLYLPSMRGDGIRLAVALDTSGSTLDLLPDFISEVERALEACPHFNLTLIQCSYEVNAIDDLTHRDLTRVRELKLQGGGGTRFQPVFDLLNRRDQRVPNLLIYLTDGQGPPVSQAPNFPVIWVLSDGGKRPASFGVELPLTQEVSGPA